MIRSYLFYSLAFVSLVAAICLYGQNAGISAVLEITLPVILGLRLILHTENTISVWDIILGLALIFIVPSAIILYCASFSVAFAVIGLFGLSFALVFCGSVFANIEEPVKGSVVHRDLTEGKKWNYFTLCSLSGVSAMICLLIPLWLGFPEGWIGALAAMLWGYFYVNFMLRLLGLIAKVSDIDLKIRYPFLRLAQERIL